MANRAEAAEGPFGSSEERCAWETESGALWRLPFSNQYVFAKTMGNNAELCAKLVERVLGRKVKDVRFAHSEHALTSIAGRSVRLDVLLEGAEEVIDVEMQSTISADLPKRVLSRILRKLPAGPRPSA